MLITLSSWKTSRGYTILFLDFSKAFDFIHRGKVEQILLAYGLLKETYSHNDALWKHESQSSLTGWRHRFLRHCCWSSVRRTINTLSVFNLPSQRTWNVDKCNKRKCLYIKKKARTSRHPAETIMDTDYADDMQATGNISLHMNANKTDYMCFNWKRAIAILKSSENSREVHVPR